MERDGHQNDSAGLESTNTTGQGASHKNYIAGLYTILLVITGILASWIQLKFPNGSAYETDYSTRLMKTFTIEIVIYLVSLVVLAFSARRNNADLEDLMNIICLLCGTLPMISEIFLLFKLFAWFILSVWIVCLIYFVYKYRHSLKTLCKNAVELLLQAWGGIRQTLVDWNSRRRIIVMLCRNAVEHLVQAWGGIRQTLVDWNSRSRIIVTLCRNQHLVQAWSFSMSIKNGERAIEFQPGNLNISNDRRATEHQSQNQNRTSVAEHVVSIPDDS